MTRGYAITPMARFCVCFNLMLHVIPQAESSETPTNTHPFSLGAVDQTACFTYARQALYY